MNNVMSQSIYISAFLGSALIIILIFINYIAKFNTDDFQRKIVLTLLCTVFTAIVMDFIRSILQGNSSPKAIGFIYACTSIYLIAQNCTYYLSVVFLDYFTYKNINRTKKFLTISVIILALYAVSVFINLPFGYYFTISDNGYLIHGNLYILRLILSYGAILLIVVNLLLSIKYYKNSQIYSILLFLFITAAGATIDLVFNKTSLMWPCFTAAVLFIYFFIIQSDLKIDSLTGLANRSSFNEFIDKISRQNSKLEYKIVMIDMDRFKEINDTLGHLEGDNALRDMAAIIKRCIRQSDFAARYGGDEFILAAGADCDVQKLMSRILDTINQQNEKRIHPYQLYISYGCDVFTTKSGEAISDFLAKIDALMYKQKEERKMRGIPTSITAKLTDGKEENV